MSALPEVSTTSGDVAQPAPAPDVPVRASGLELIGEIPGSGYRQPPALVRRADGQTIQLTRLLYLVLEAVDGERGQEEIAAVVGPALGRQVTSDNVRTLCDRLRTLGALKARRRLGARPATVKPVAGAALSLRRLRP